MESLFSKAPAYKPASILHYKCFSVDIVYFFQNGFSTEYLRLTFSFSVMAENIYKQQKPDKIYEIIRSVVNTGVILEVTDQMFLL